MRFFLLAFVALLISPPTSFAQSDNAQSTSEEPDEIVLTDSLAVQAIDEAYTSIDEYHTALQTENKSRLVSAVRTATRSELLFGLYIKRSSLSVEKEKYLSKVKSMMSQLSSDLPEKVVVSDLSDQKRVAMPIYTVLEMVEASLDKFVVE